jgi:hypothetical protein
VNIPPQTLFDINPIYPKSSPTDQPKPTTSKFFNNKTNILSLTYIKDEFHQTNIFLLVNTHRFMFIILIWVLSLVIGLLLLLIIILQANRNKQFSTNNHRSKKIIVGGETSSLSGWLTKRRFQQYDQDDHYHHRENQPLTSKHRWASTSTSEESDLSDNEVFDRTDFRNVILRN